MSDEAVLYTTAIASMMIHGNVIILKHVFFSSVRRSAEECGTSQGID